MFYEAAHHQTQYLVASWTSNSRLLSTDNPNQTRILIPATFSKHVLLTTAANTRKWTANTMSVSFQRFSVMRMTQRYRISSPIGKSSDWAMLPKLMRMAQITHLVSDWKVLQIEQCCQALNMILQFTFRNHPSLFAGSFFQNIPEPEHSRTF